MAWRVIRHRSPANVRQVEGAERRPLQHSDGTPIDFENEEAAVGEARRLNEAGPPPNVWFTAESTP